MGAVHAAVCTARMGVGWHGCQYLHLHLASSGFVAGLVLHVQLTVVLTITSGVGSGWAFSGAQLSTVAKANCSQQGAHSDMHTSGL
jgi:hypothetical protein